MLYALIAVSIDWLNQVNIFYSGFAPVYQLLTWISSRHVLIGDAPVIAFTLIGPVVLVVLAKLRERRVGRPHLVAFPIMSFSYTIAVPVLSLGLGLPPLPLWWVFDLLCLIKGQADEVPE